MKRLVFDPEACILCESCVLACSLAHEGAVSLSRSRIVVTEAIHLHGTMAHVCRQCKDTPCVQSCPVDALIQDKGTGAISVNRERCVACGACETACPFGGIRIDQKRRDVLVCDLCSGDPRCVQVCIPGALSFSDKGNIPCK